MLYKEDIYDDWKHREWRYWCECRTPDHVLGFDEDLDRSDWDLNIYICSHPNMTLWSRIKNAFKLLFGKEVVYLDVMISPEDRKELAAAIYGDDNEQLTTRPDGQSGDQGQAT
jgi:hypothetical protein